jgi:hypothetical protein
MSKTNDTSRPTALDDHRPLADRELDAVTGGFFADYVKQLLGTSVPFSGCGLARACKEGWLQAP